MRENRFIFNGLSELLPAGNVARREEIMAGSNWLLSMMVTGKNTGALLFNQLRVNARPARKNGNDAFTISERILRRHWVLSNISGVTNECLCVVAP